MKVFTFLFAIIFISVAQASENAGSRFEIRTAPAMIVFGRWLTLDATYILNNNWAVGPSYVSYANSSEYGNMFATTYYGNAYGAHLIWSADDLYSDSWYVGSHAYYESYRSIAHSFYGNKEDRKGLRTSAVIGYRQHNGNFLTMVGFGFENYNYEVASIKSAADPVYKEFNRNFTFFHAEFKIGWMF